MEYLADLHTHATASDGQYTPMKLARLSRQHDIQILTVADHDTIAGRPLAADFGIVDRHPAV